MNCQLTIYESYNKYQQYMNCRTLFVLRTYLQLCTVLLVDLDVA